MMKGQLFSRLVLSLFAVFTLLVPLGCAKKGPPAHAKRVEPHKVVYHYRYYPEAQIYYAPHRKIYFWLERGMWYSGPALPKGVALKGKKVKVELDTGRPYRRHGQTVAKYPAKPTHKAATRQATKKAKKAKKK